LHAAYALTACGVVAGNRWDGWLSEHRDKIGDESQKIHFNAADMDKILEQSSYYFHLPDHDNDPSRPYPIVPTFQEWPFPHDQLPPSWIQAAPPETAEQTFSISGLTTALMQRDISCRITGYRESVQVAHICPQSEEDWYLRNGMPRYSDGNTASVDNPANALLLRADLHIAFDKPKFVFVPKPSVDGEPRQFAVHLVEPSRELESLYHNRALQGLGVSLELLFARFAWTIFPWLAGFLKGRMQRCLRLSTTIDDATGTEMPPFFASAEQCENLLVKSSKSRNYSPKKRGRPEDNGAETSPLHEGEHRPRKRHRDSKSLSDLSPITATSVESPDGLIESPSQPSPATPEEPAQYDDPTTLRQEWLQRERLRSDRNKSWEEEMVWAADVYKGNVTLGEVDTERWLKFNGGELQDGNFV
jgi:hypothetical protein